MTTTTTSMRLPAAELAKLEPARSRPAAHAVPRPEAEPEPRLRRAVRTVVGFARA